MEKEKNNKVYIIIIIILSFFVIGLVSYIFWDKYYLNNETDNKIQEVENDTIDNETKKFIIDDKYYLDINDENLAIEIGKSLWNYAKGAYWGMDNVWKNCTTSFEEVKSYFSKDFTYETSHSGPKPFDTFIYSTDELPACMGAARGSDQVYKDTELEINKIENGKIIFNATSKYCDSPFCEESDNIAKEITKDFIIVKENGRWVISYFYLPN